jgi:hypothetical protein
MIETAKLNPDFEHVILQVSGNELKHIGFPAGCYLEIDKTLNPEKGDLVVLGVLTIGGARNMSIAVYDRNLFFRLAVAGGSDLKKLALVGTVISAKAGQSGKVVQ